MNKTGKQASKQQSKSPLTQQKRGILSYRSNPNDPRSQRRKAKCMFFSFRDPPPRDFAANPGLDQHRSSLFPRPTMWALP